MDTVLKYQCQEIADHYGLEEQQKKMIEELDELERAIYSHRTSEIVEELADVAVMGRQLAYLLDVEPEVVNAIDYKVQRQLLRIRDEKEEEENAD